jgi:hypothetical protein
MGLRRDVIARRRRPRLPDHARDLWEHFGIQAWSDDFIRSACWRNHESQFRDRFHIIQPHPQPHGVGLGFLTLIQRRQDALKRLAQRTEVDHVFTLKPLLQFPHDLFELLPF